MLFGNCLHLAAVQTQSHSSIGASGQETPRKENKKLPAENSGCSGEAKSWNIY